MRNVFLKAIMSVALVSLLALGSCAKQRDVSDDLEKRVAALEATSKELGTRLDAVVKDLAGVKDQLTKEVQALDAKVVALEKNGATKAELDAAKKELLAKVVTLEAFNDFKTKTEGDVKSIKADLDKKADKSELTKLEGRVQTLENWRTTVDADITKLKKDVEERKEKHDELKLALEARLNVLEALLKVAEGKSEVLDKIQADLTDHAGKIKSNTSEINIIKQDLTNLTGRVTKNEEDITKLFSEITRVDGRITTLEGKLDLKITEVYAAIAKLASEVRGLTFIPTRGLYEEKTAKLYYYADDYSALHTLIFQVSPSTAKLGTDFTVEGLQYQITTRAIDEKYDAANIDIVIDGEVTQVGDRIYVPVRVKNTKEDSNVYGMFDGWWNNKYFYNAMASMQLKPAHFPAYTVNNDERTFEDKTYKVVSPTQMMGTEVKLRNELTADATHSSYATPQFENSADRIDALSINLVVKNLREDAENTVKASEYVHANLIPVQIKLAWNNPEAVGSLKEQILPTTQVEAVNKANTHETTAKLGVHWHAHLWRGTYIVTGGDRTYKNDPIDLNKLVQSYYYPADGADFSQKGVMPDDPFRHSYDNLGTFGKPETDKPVFEAPQYKYELVAYTDNEGEVISGKNIYAELIDGHILAPIEDNHLNASGKKLIVRVTQVNSELKARQPIGYLIIKMTEQPMVQPWENVKYLIDSKKNYLINCTSGGNINTLTIDEATSTTYDKASALAILQEVNFNTIGTNSDFANSPYTLGVKDPATGNYVYSDYVESYVKGLHPDALIKSKSSLKFTPADNNLIKDQHVINEAWNHIEIRYNRADNKYDIKVKDNLAPAGTYEATFYLRHVRNDKMEGPDFELSFIFTIGINDVTVERDAAANWEELTIDGEKHDALFIEYSRIDNTNNRNFLDPDGYRAQLTQAFKLDINKKFIKITSKNNVGKFAADCNPSDIYNLRFEFITEDEQVLKSYDELFNYLKDEDKFANQLRYSKSMSSAINKDNEGWEFIKLQDNKFGDYSYNYLIGDREPGKEKALWVRLVADVVYDAWNKDAAPQLRSLNRVEIDRFPVVFERALRFMFTPIVLEDNQAIQEVTFNFTDPFTYNYSGVNVGRGAYAIHPYASDNNNGKIYHATKDNAIGQWFGLKEGVEFPRFEYKGNSYVDYEYIEISEDGGESWTKMKNSAYKDYMINSAHSPRYFAIKYNADNNYTVQWQGENLSLKTDLMFRVAVLNKTAIESGLVRAINAAKFVIAPNQDLTIAFRHGIAKVYTGECYANFTVKKRPNPNN